MVSRAALNATSVATLRKLTWAEASPRNSALDLSTRPTTLTTQYTNATAGVAVASARGTCRPNSTFVRADLLMSARIDLAPNERNLRANYWPGGATGRVDVIHRPKKASVGEALSNNYLARGRLGSELNRVSHSYPVVAANRRGGSKARMANSSIVVSVREHCSLCSRTADATVSTAELHVPAHVRSKQVRGSALLSSVMPNASVEPNAERLLTVFCCQSSPAVNRRRPPGSGHWIRCVRAHLGIPTADPARTPRPSRATTNNRDTPCKATSSPACCCR